MLTPRDGDGDGRINDGTPRESAIARAKSKANEATVVAAKKTKEQLAERYYAKRPGEMSAAYILKNGMKALADVERTVGVISPSDGITTPIANALGITSPGIGLIGDSMMDGKAADVLDMYAEISGLALQDSIERMKAMTSGEAYEFVRGAITRAKRLLGIMSKMEGRVEPDIHTLTLMWLARHGKATPAQQIALAAKIR